MSGVIPHSAPSTAATVGGARRKGVTVKTLKKALKKAGLKVSGKKATLTRRAKKAHLKMKGGENGETAEQKKASEEAEKASEEAEKAAEEASKAADKAEEAADVAMGGRRRSRKSRGFRLY
jgi:hypothetical protein